MEPVTLVGLTSGSQRVEHPTLTGYLRRGYYRPSMHGTPCSRRECTAWEGQTTLAWPPAGAGDFAIPEEPAAWSLESPRLGPDRCMCKWYISHPASRPTLKDPLLFLLFARYSVVCRLSNTLLLDPYSLPQLQ